MLPPHSFAPPSQCPGLVAPPVSECVCVRALYVCVCVCASVIGTENSSDSVACKIEAGQSWKLAANTARTFSECMSSAEVASSSSKILGFLTTALAIATRCFCPPDSWTPLSPTYAFVCACMCVCVCVCTCVCTSVCARVCMCEVAKHATLEEMHRYLRLLTSFERASFHKRVFVSTCSHLCVVALRQVHNELVCVCCPCSCLDFLHACIGARIPGARTHTMLRSYLS